MDINKFGDLIPKERATTVNKETGKKETTKIHLGNDIELNGKFAEFEKVRGAINEKRKSLGYNLIDKKEFALEIANKNGGELHVKNYKTSTLAIEKIVKTAFGISE
jgi:hypothetical protein